MSNTLPPLNATVLVFLGIILSVLLPLAVKALRKATGFEAVPRPSFSERLKAAWIRYGGNKYLVILLAGTLVATVIVFVLGMAFFTARDAILAGFAWESLLNKTLAKNNP
jgi:hypothetical protein